MFQNNVRKAGAALIQTVWSEMDLAWCKRAMVHWREIQWVILSGTKVSFSSWIMHQAHSFDHHVMLLSESLTQPHHGEKTHCCDGMQLCVACPRPCPQPKGGGSPKLPPCRVSPTPSARALGTKIFWRAQDEMAAAPVWYFSWTRKSPQNLNIQWTSDQRGLFLSKILLFLLYLIKLLTFPQNISVGSVSFLSTSNHS